MSFKDLIQKRRSHRKFSDEKVTSDEIRTILRAALMSPTSKGQRSWNFAIVTDRQKIDGISSSKDFGASFASGAPLIILVLGPASQNDCWIEDCSIAAFAMQLQAEDLGLGSCWIQLRGRGHKDGITADSVLHQLLSLPDDMSVLCAIAIGRKQEERRLQDEEKLNWDKVLYC